MNTWLFYTFTRHVDAWNRCFMCINRGQNNKQPFLLWGTTCIFWWTQRPRPHLETTNALKCAAWPASHPICLRLTHSSERSPHPRKRNNQRKQESITLSPHMLYFRSPHRLQEILLRNEKDMLCGGHEHPKASPLFWSLTNQPLNDIFGNWDSFERIGKWAMELSKHVIDFEKRNTIKSQILADFIANWTEPFSYTECPVTDTPLQVYCDRDWIRSRVGDAAILVSLSGIKLRYAAHL
jgi:hypothetical protein